MQPQQSDLSVQVESLNHVAVARFSREVILSGQEAEAAGDQLMSLLAEPGKERLLVDFGNVLSLTSIMLGKLIQLNRAAEFAGGRLALFNLRPDIREILEVTRLTLVLNVYDNAQEALQSF